MRCVYAHMDVWVLPYENIHARLIMLLSPVCIQWSGDRCGVDHKPLMNVKLKA